MKRAKQKAVTADWPKQRQTLLQEYPILVVLSVILFLLARYSITYGAGSDPRYTLIVAQSILDNGTIELNAYQNDEIWGAPANFEADMNILKVNGRYYNYFPVGPSLLSVPFVAVTKVLGWDMRHARDNINAQQLLSAFSVVMVFWLVYHTTRIYVVQTAALVITFISICGSTLISTLGVAWWSSNFSVLFIALSLLLLALYDAGKSTTVHPLVLGLLLFLAYLSRAAAAAFIVPVFLYLALKDWRHMVQTAVTAALLLALFLLWSHQAFGTWLPIYYSIVRLQVERSPLWLALYGHLFSPARGLFVFSPFLLLLLPGLWMGRGKVRQRPFLWLCLLWLGLHLYVASRGTNWWGGHSFGPRILTELMLALALLTAWLWHEAQISLPRRQQTRGAALYLVLGVTAVFIHSYQGLYNYSTALWNAVVQEYPTPPYTPPLGDLFNWRYPQFLATNQMLCSLEAERAQTLLAQDPLLTDYAWGTPLLFDPTATSQVQLTAARLAEAQTPPLPALFVGWDPAANDRAWHRATICDKVSVYFRVTAVPAQPISLVIRSAAFDSQRAIISLNGQLVGEWRFQQQPKLAAETAVLPLDPTLFQANAINELILNLPDARRASYYDPSRLALAIADITFCPADFALISTGQYNCPTAQLPPAEPG